MRNPGLILVALLLLSPVPGNAIPEMHEGVSPEVEQAALAGNWQSVNALLEQVDAQTVSPLSRLLKAHASLATNHNNRSLTLFASALDDDSRRQWLGWTEGLVARHAEEANASYFYGDALARMQDWAGATRAFDEALRLNPQSHLALNARAIVSHAVGNTLQARVFFGRAAEQRPDFAAAYAGRGALNVYQNSSRAAQAFEAAARNTRDADAYVNILGAGCVAFGEGDYDGAETLFARIPDDSPLSLLAQRNRLATQLARIRVLAEQAEAVGTTLDSMEISSIGGRMLSAKVRIRIGGTVLPPGIPIIYIDVIVEPDDKPAEPPASTATAMVMPPELLPPFGFPPGIPYPFGPDIFPEPGRPAPLDSTELNDVIAAVAEATQTADLQVQQATQAVMTTQTEPGGADADSRRVRSSRGPWPVMTVYGLLYAIPQADAPAPADQTI